MGCGASVANGLISRQGRQGRLHGRGPPPAAAKIPAAPPPAPAAGGRGDNLPAPRPDEVPAYWENKGNGKDHFDTRHTVPAGRKKEVFQRILDETYKKVATRDRQGAQIPAQLKVLMVQRIEDSRMWMRYRKRMGEIRRKRHRIPKVEELDEDPDHGHVKTALVSDNTLLAELDESLNEHYLFHGTSPTATLGISEHGFWIAEKAGSNKGTMFGPGAYLAECSSKSDEYATDDGTGIYQGMFAFVFCRVACGKMLRVEKAAPNMTAQKLKEADCDSVLGDRESSVGTYREFVIFDEAQIYPEYVIVYERVFPEG